jgi:hypothetical protein
VSDDELVAALSGIASAIGRLGERNAVNALLAKLVKAGLVVRLGGGMAISRERTTKCYR